MKLLFCTLPSSLVEWKAKKNYGIYMEISFIKNFTSRSSDQVQGLGPRAHTQLTKKYLFLSLNKFVFAVRITK